MILSKKHQALILRLRDPNRVLSVLPKARLLEHEGKQFVAVKHGVAETRILRSIGIEAPAPIQYYYKWPGRFPPFNAQREAAAFLSLEPRAFNLSDMGTGKTLGALWAYDYLRSVGAAGKVIIASPLSTLERTWADEVFQHFPHLVAVVLHGSRDKRLKLLATDADIYLINHDGLKVAGMVEAINERADITHVIPDEIAQVGRRAGTDRFKALNRIINGPIKREAWGLTGTPIPNSPTDAWAQCRLLVPARVPPYFNRFRDLVMKQVSTFTWAPRENALEVVQEAMQPSIRFSRDECVDLPPCVFQYRHVELTPAQKRAYKDMMSRLKTEAENGEITAVNEAVKGGKLIQICCGVAYGSDGGEVTVDAKPRMEVVLEVIEEAPSKVIVFVPYVSAVKALMEFLQAKGIDSAAIHGSVSKHQRDEIFHGFQRMDSPRVLVAQPAAMSHGLTLTAASTIVWYAPGVPNEIFQQANARIVRPGQKLNQLIVMIEGSIYERKRYKDLETQQNTQGLLLKLVQGQRETELIDEPTT